jgi:hypothetical protein
MWYGERSQNKLCQLNPLLIMVHVEVNNASCIEEKGSSEKSGVYRLPGYRQGFVGNADSPQPTTWGPKRSPAAYR